MKRTSKKNVIENFTLLIKKMKDGWKNMSFSDKCWIILGLIAGLISIIAGFLAKRDTLKTDFMEAGNKFLQQFQEEKPVPQDLEPDNESKNNAAAANDIARRAQRQRQTRQQGKNPPTPINHEEQAPVEEAPANEEK